MNRGTQDGNQAEINFVKHFNSNKTAQNFSYYIKSCKIDSKINDIYAIRITTKQFSKLSKQVVMTRADVYLIESKDSKLKSLLIENDYYLDEQMLIDNNIKYSSIKYSGISIKMHDSEKFQIIKFTPESFNTLFGEFELGACASIFCKNANEIEKNNSVFTGWHTTKNNVINKYKEIIPELELLNLDIDTNKQMEIYKKTKNFANLRIKEIIDNNSKFKEIIFNGYHIYEEPYTASFFFKGNNIEKLEYIPFKVTTGSGRTKGIFTIVLKP